MAAADERSRRSRRHPPRGAASGHRASAAGWSGAWSAFFFIFLFGLIATVVLDSFATTWFGSWLPDDFTTHWYGDAWAEFNLTKCCTVTAQVAITVVVISALIGVPAAYALARRNFPGQEA